MAIIGSEQVIRLPSPPRPRASRNCASGARCSPRTPQTPLAAFTVAYRDAVQIRVAVPQVEAEQTPGSVLPPSRGVNVVARLRRWVRATVEGLVGSANVIKLACASGILLQEED